MRRGLNTEITVVRDTTIDKTGEIPLGDNLKVSNRKTE